ncbi:MAG: DNA polymerase Y family protein [Gammaproteobacteria bacterium]|nr:DNA polymerase Y family protein [Gammaproteobacteria bacterium]
MLWLYIRLPRLAREALAGVDTPAECRAPPWQAALERLAAWALQWSSHVHPGVEIGGTPGLWIELGASLTLFGGLTPLLTRIRAALEPLRYSTQCGVAPTPAGAALLARTGGILPETTLAGLRARLVPLPLGLLALPEATLAACNSAGVRTIGTLLALADAAIAQRFGPAASRYLQQLTGRTPEPLPAWQPPDRWHARCEFPSPVEATTALLFPLQRLLHEFAGYLRAGDRAVQRFTLTLEQHGRASLPLPIGLSVPGRDAAQFLRLARERLAGATPTTPVSALVLAADAFSAPVTQQIDCLAPERDAASDLQQLLDRLGARLGDGAVRRLAPHADHRPERAWRYRPPSGTIDNPRAAAAVAPCAADLAAPATRVPRPCWLLPQPRAITLPSKLLSGPERIESGWWDGADAARDYYLARDALGARLWVFRDLRSGEWHLAGLWS